ncbi:alpha/beta hydrolase [Streptomyces angustmyceticus]|uniref:Proteinase n=1 Tax=Streptomyces angustmyceticus TaxID=285578 RepID=A0A5J4L9D5_9ACTN|nr:alpha/beta hydrolase [Streptomyces angustmyceticus]UAL67891.1 alpha/beta hydrolase [Streptomyces angustmyceticus]GES30977.1 proteinase [Streptomyces angustmyceticus]
MATSRLLRTSAAFLAATALLISGCSSGSSSPDDEASPGLTTEAGAQRPAEEATLAPLPASTPAGLRSYYDQKLTWHACGNGFQCATMKAPLDYSRPEAGDIKLAVARRKATGPGSRLGSLLVNPGGPGGSAIDYLEQYAPQPASIRARYDMAAMDPRGVDHSQPIECLSNKQMDRYTETDQTPDSPAEVNKLTTAFRDFAKGCASRSGKLLSHVSTVEAARDMDMLRAVLGDKKLNFVAASYGTFLGATYAGLYPSRVGRMVLDGAMNPELDSRTTNIEQTAGFDTAFTAFAKDCIKRKNCPLGTKSTQDAGEQLSALFKKLDAHPAATGEDRKLTESLAGTGVIAALYDQRAWPLLRDYLAQAKAGNGRGLLAFSDSYYERSPNGSYSNQMYANPAVNCLDLPPAFTSPEQVRAALPSFRKASPVFGENFAWAALNCAYWPVKPTGTAHRIEAKGAAPILVVGTTRDPATPYIWAKALASQLSSATLLTYDGDGHTAYGRGSTCIDNTINAYLLDGTVPPKHKVCK